MKNLVYVTMFMFIIASSVAVAQTANEDLPAKASAYIKEHFPEQKILYTQYENKVVSKEYEVKLDNGIELEFNGSGDITKIDGENNIKLPDSVINAKILEYVKAKYPTNHITDWELEYNTQEIQLNNDLDLDFDKNGNFVRIDKD